MLFPNEACAVRNPDVISERSLRSEEYLRSSWIPTTHFHLHDKKPLICIFMELETPRLRLRKFTLDDAAFIMRLVNEPSWLQFIGDRNVHSLEDAERYLLNGTMRSYADNGFGSGMVILKETGEEIGMCGLFKRDYLEEIDLGFALLPEYTGKGYALEIAEATLHYAKEVLGFPRVAAFTAKDNHASMRLLARIGFKPAGTIDLEGEELNLFKTD